jgi:diguanylate cyclase (GGDEF)-like protein
MVGHDQSSRVHALTPLSPELPLQHSGANAVRLVVDALSKARSPEDVGHQLLTVLTQLLPSAAAAVFVADQESSRLQPLAAVDVEPPVLEQLLAVIADRPLQQPEILPANVAPPHLPPPYTCLLVLPLAAGGIRAGLGLVLLHASYRLGAAATDALAAIAGSAALALQAAVDRQALCQRLAAERHAREQAEAMARSAHERGGQRAGMDALTGLASSRRFHTQLEIEVERARRYGDPLALLLIDIDHFKRFNQTYGHDAGNHVLAQLGRMLQQELRKIDSAFRYGGEEFTVILPRCDRDCLLNLAQRLRERFAAEVFRAGEQRARLSVSIGAAAYQRGAPIESFIRDADNALYRAKTAGRNRVVLAS